MERSQTMSSILSEYVDSGEVVDMQQMSLKYHYVIIII